jgi:hypothetical protein
MMAIIFLCTKKITITYRLSRGDDKRENTFSYSRLKNNVGVPPV